MTDETSDGFSPARFHQQPGVDDWRVTSWGPQACFRASSLDAASALVPKIVEAATQFAIEPDVDLRPEAVVVRIHYRGADEIAAGGPAFAAAVSAAASELALTAAPELITTVDIAVAQDAEIDCRPFWNAVLNYDEYWDSDSIDPLRRGPQLSFQKLDRKGRGRIVDDSNAPAWWTLASPDNHGVDIAAWNDTWD